MGIVGYHRDLEGDRKGGASGTLCALPLLVGEAIRIARRARWKQSHLLPIRSQSSEQSLLNGKTQYITGA
jgi:hypothetical protein